MEEKNRIYADCAATTPVLPAVLEAMLPYLTESFGNPSSQHDTGQRAREVVEIARMYAAALIGASPEDVFFTSGGTESSNWAIKGTALQELAQGGKRRRILVSAVEHPSVLRAAESLIPLGFTTERIPVDSRGLVSVDALRGMVGEDCLLVAVMHANNETGVIEPVAECASIAHACGARFLADGVQTVGHIPVNAADLNCDFLTFSGHKLNAPKGVGGLYVKKGVTLVPLIHGGGQERGERSGTENVPGIVGLGEACRLASERIQSGEAERLGALRDRLEKRLLACCACHVNGEGAERVPGTMNLSFTDVHGENVMFLCDLFGLRISTGAACSGGKGERISHVLRAMGMTESAAIGSVRISIGCMTDEEEMDRIAERVFACVQRAKGDDL